MLALLRECVWGPAQGWKMIDEGSCRSAGCAGCTQTRWRCGNCHTARNGRDLSVPHLALLRPPVTCAACTVVQLITHARASAQVENGRLMELVNLMQRRLEGS